MTQKSSAPSSLKKVHIFSVPISDIAPDEIGDTIDYLINSQEASQIVFISWWELIRAICKWDYKSLVRNATLVIPTSPLISFGMRILRKRGVHYHSSFDFVIKVLSRIEAHGKSVYLLGMEMAQIQHMESNIKNTFPNLMIVGRYSGYFSSAQEQSIITAIKKSNATLLFAGNGISHGEVWLYRVKHKLQPCITLWSGHTMDILAAKIKNPSHTHLGRFRRWIREYILHPWRIYRLFIFIWYVIALCYVRIFRR